MPLVEGKKKPFWEVCREGRLLEKGVIAYPAISARGGKCVSLHIVEKRGKTREENGDPCLVSNFPIIRREKGKGKGKF